MGMCPRYLAWVNSRSSTSTGQTSLHFRMCNTCKCIAACVGYLECCQHRDSCSCSRTNCISPRGSFCEKIACKYLFYWQTKTLAGCVFRKATWPGLPSACAEPGEVVTRAKVSKVRCATENAAKCSEQTPSLRLLHEAVDNLFAPGDAPPSTCPTWDVPASTSRCVAPKFYPSSLSPVPARQQC
jgi:hypothetical protein